MNEWFETIQLGSELLKGSVLLLATSLFVCLLRKASATSLYRVWLLGLCMALLVAVTSGIAPICNLSLPIFQTQVDTLSFGSIAQESKPEFVDLTQEKSSHVTSVTPPHVEKATDVLTGSAHVHSSFHQSIGDPDPSIHANLKSVNRLSVEAASNPLWKHGFPTLGQLILRWWTAIWFLGMAAILLRTLAQYVSAYKVLDHCEQLEDRTATQLCADLSQRLSVTAPELLVHENSVTPFAAGIWRPRIVLPAGFSDWSSQKLRFVMLHELAHIKRRDLLTQLIARVAVAVYWFNPLSWWGYAQLMRLRELACDDWVLQQEQEPANYAETLLDIATHYSSHQQAIVIGMSGKLDIARRIHSALDGTRARTTFSKRTLRCVTSLGLALCLVLGVIQLRSVAVEPQVDTPTAAAGQQEVKPAGSSPKVQEIDEEARSMVVRVLDEDSQPLSGVDVYVTGVDNERRGKVGNLPRVHYPTDALGETRIKFREGSLSLQLWQSKSGYVPQYVNFDEKKQPFPAEYTLYFEKGTRLAGKVTDTSGNPIEGVSVQVKTSGAVELSTRAQQSSPPAKCTGWLASEDRAVLTNADGEWEIFNAPSVERNPELKFELLVDHPDFAGDRRWGDYQTKQGITSEQLRNGTATLEMDRGAILRGMITGPEGQPVAKGLVIFVSNPYFATGDNEVQIQSDGSYQLPNMRPGKYPITVLAPEFAPDQREVEISDGLHTSDFQLEHGHPIRIEIVDSKGEPIPNASVAFGSDGWRGTSAIYNEDHSGVPDSGIPRRADEHGIFKWDWAPADGVQYSIYASGYDSKSVTLVAKTDAHRVVLTSPLSISGNVTDAVSGEPIARFKVMPVKAFRPDFYSTDFQENSVVHGENGQYKIPIDTGGEGTDRYRVRIEADGYRTAFGTTSVAAGDPPLVEDFKVQPAKPLIGDVATVDGKSVSRFKVAIGTATSSPQFDFDRPETSFGKSFDVDGRNTFEIAASFETQRIRVFNNDGFAEIVVRPEQDEIGKVVLQPYAVLSGRLMQGTVPISTEGIYFYPLVQRGLTEARFQDSFYTRTDPEGYFKFDRLPPIAGNIHALLGPWRDSALTSSQSIPLDLKPGDQKQVILNGNGVPIVGHVVATGRSDDKFSKQWSLNWLVSRAEGVNSGADAAPLSIPSDSGPIESAWLKHTDFSAWLSTKQNYFVKLQEDGKFTIHGVPAGEYDLVIQLFDQPAGCLVEAVGTRVLPVTVTAEEVGAGSLDLGSIEVICRAGPRPGSAMRAFQYVNSEGMVVRVNDAGGHYLLFHFWASWCQPCLASMPELEADIEAQKDKSFTAIGFNIDADKNRGRALAERLNMDWTQNYLGDDSDFAQQLAVSSVPAYYLIGPDGMLIGSSSEWKEMRKLLQERLKR